MHLTKFCKLPACYCMWYSSGELNHNKAMSQIYKSWSLHYSNSTRTSTGACITQNQKDWESFRLNHKHSRCTIGYCSIKHRFIQKSIIKCSYFCNKLNSNISPTNPQTGKPKKGLDFFYKNSCFAMFTALFSKWLSLYYHHQSALERLITCNFECSQAANSFDYFQFECFQK